tara:strand:- start:1191 stop:3698 length:2508 start_codon:yes stop_codon:yes gene_type:complete
MWEATLYIACIAAVALMIKPTLYEISKVAGLSAHLLLMLPFFALVSRFLVNDTSIQYVAAFGGEALPMKYRFAATWAAREGPILMWVVWLTILAWLWRRPMAGKSVESIAARNFRQRIMYGFSLTLLLIAAVLNPFKKTPEFFFGSGLNELLQTDLMIIHPPLIFLAYSFCIFITAISLSGIFTSEVSGIDERILSLVRPGLLVTTIGIGLGGLWAYLILDWGGYWAWDPVETGSFLPWLALVGLSHMRTRPGKVSEKGWIGAGLVVGALALFATLVTRAGGVWASSVHTFVISDTGSAPNDAFSRMMLLKNDSMAGVEIMTYLMFILLIIGSWLLLNRQSQHGRETPNSALLLLVPTVGSACAIFLGADLYHWVPDVMIFGLMMGFVGLDKMSNPRIERASSSWSFYSGKYLPSILIIPLALYLLIPKAFFVLLFVVFFTPMYYSDNAANEWIWASLGIMLALAGAWSGMVSVILAAVVILVFLAPFLVEEDESSSTTGWLTMRRLNLTALWSSVMLVSLYLVLTLVILLESIDTVNFDAHELYGAPFLLGFAAAMLTYTRRKANHKTTIYAIVGVVIFSMFMAIFYSDTLGGDSSTALSEYIDRGLVAWISFPMLLILVGPLAFEIKEQASKNGKGKFWLKIPFNAHIVHLGLVLLLIGHITTTVLVDRGDASHRITLVKDEIIINGDYGYEFTELMATEDGLEVGDGFVGAKITVYDYDGGEFEEIGVVEPGMLRFDRTGTARSEVDVLSRWSGDMVFIFDGTQAQGLMQQTSSSGLESVNLVRVTIYDLPGSHLVWIGWSLMMLGMLGVTYSGINKTKQLAAKNQKLSEQE